MLKRSCCLAAMDDDAAAGRNEVEPEGLKWAGELGMG